MKKDTDNKGSGSVSEDFMEYMHAWFQLSPENEDEINAKFEDLVFYLGEYVAGDEKLWKFLGESGWLRKVLSKPDKIGHWFYELCLALSNGRSFLLNLKLHKAAEEEGIIHVDSVVKTWTEVIERKKQHGVECFLAMDSYYWSAATRKVLYQSGIPYAASCTRERLGFLGDVDEENTLLDTIPVTKPGDTRGLENLETAELIIHHLDTNPDIGEKFVAGRGLERYVVLDPKQKSSIPNYKAHLVPLYSVYKELFAVCDHFNVYYFTSTLLDHCLNRFFRQLKKRLDAFGYGGRDHNGTLGNIHSFYFSSILVNIYNAYDDALPEKHKDKDMSFGDFVKELAQDMWVFAIELTQDSFDKLPN